MEQFKIIENKLKQLYEEFVIVNNTVFNNQIIKKNSISNIKNDSTYKIKQVQEPDLDIENFKPLNNLKNQNSTQFKNLNKIYFRDEKINQHFHNSIHNSFKSKLQNYNTSSMNVNYSNNNLKINIFKYDYYYYKSNQIYDEKYSDVNIISQNDISINKIDKSIPEENQNLLQMLGDQLNPSKRTQSISKSITQKLNSIKRESTATKKADIYKDEKKDSFVKDYSKNTLNKNDGRRLAKQSFGMRKKIAWKSQIIDAIGKDDLKSLDQFKYEISIATMGTLALESNLSYKIIYTNNQITDKLLQDRLELIGSDFLSILPKKDQEIFLQMIDKYFESNSNYSSENFLLNFQDKSQNLVIYDVTISKKFIDSSEIPILYISLPSEEDNWVIESKNPFQLIWVAFITLNLLFITIQMPQDLIFNNSLVTDQLDLPSTILFGTDMILNFNVSIEIDGKNIRDRCVIIEQQLSGWFALDFISTIPISLIIYQLENFQILKSLKILRMFRFIKLLRLIKVTKITHNVIYQKDEFTKGLQKWIKQNQGYFDLLKNMMYIQLMGHFFTVIFFYLEESLICPNNSHCWLNFYYENLVDPNVSDYNYILFKNIKIALGLDQISIYSNQETYLAMAWMFIGLSMFGQGIGNISAYLSQTNKQELEHMQTQSFFSELCFMNNINPRLQNIIMEQIDGQYAKFMDRELLQQTQVMPSQVLDQLELQMQSNFTKNFPFLLEKLNITSLRLIRHNSNFTRKKVVVRRGMNIKEIQFILCGSINIQDDNMHIVTQYEKNEVYGLREFQEQVYQKQGVDVEEVMVKHTADVDVKLKGHIRNQIANLLATKDPKTAIPKNTEFLKEKIDRVNNLINFSGQSDQQKNTKKESSSLEEKLRNAFDLNGIDFKMKIGDKDDYLISNQSSICSDDVEQMNIPYQVIEEILFTDIDSFLYIQKQFNIYNREIQDSEWEQSDKILEELFDNTYISAIIKANGTIFDVNDSFCEKQIIEEEKMQDLQFLDMIQKQDNNKNKKQYQFIEDIHEGTYYLKVNETEQNVKLLIKGPVKIVNYDRKSNAKNHQMIYAKSLMQIYLVRMEIINSN